MEKGQQVTQLLYFIRQKCGIRVRAFWFVHVLYAGHMPQPRGAFRGVLGFPVLPSAGPAQGRCRARAPGVGPRAGGRLNQRGPIPRFISGPRPRVFMWTVGLAIGMYPAVLQLAEVQVRRFALAGCWSIYVHCCAQRRVNKDLVP